MDYNPRWSHESSRPSQMLPYQRKSSFKLCPLIDPFPVVLLCDMTNQTRGRGFLGCGRGQQTNIPAVCQSSFIVSPLKRSDVCWTGPVESELVTSILPVL